VLLSLDAALHYELIQGLAWNPQYAVSALVSRFGRTKIQDTSTVCESSDDLTCSRKYLPIVTEVLS
jgi:hypothetical protein